ncbi:hypothetical protein ARMSODRAFT_974364 [Armillaria solidipes]|uniref:Uncharacterized protein n=1 Tax=Armillaria solidipes TaxID=1076256 RepID=A0A2H3BHQ1_9AGAR|nr:hypothetical protein ARMSODRAFT_974364 [Armillaria solidipes]
MAALKNAQLTFGYMVHPSSPTPRKRSSPNSIIPCISMMSTTVDPLRLAARSGVSPNRICVLLLGLVAGTDSRYLCEDGDREEVVADYLCEAIFAMLLWLTMDFMDLGVLQDDLTPRNIIIRPPARPGPFPPDERCLVWLETDADDVRAVMVNFERIHVEYPSNPEVQSTTHPSTVATTVVHHIIHKLRERVTLVWIAFASFSIPKKAVVATPNFIYASMTLMAQPSLTPPPRYSVPRQRSESIRQARVSPKDQCLGL